MKKFLILLILIFVAIPKIEPVNKTESVNEKTKKGFFVGSFCAVTALVIFFLRHKLFHGPVSVKKNQNNVNQSEKKVNLNEDLTFNGNNTLNISQKRDPVNLLDFVKKRIEGVDLEAEWPEEEEKNNFDKIPLRLNPIVSGEGRLRKMILIPWRSLKYCQILTIKFLVTVRVVLE